jgi:endonuclease/exonuclease/phosphatase family metal-dependent hydrolase
MEVTLAGMNNFYLAIIFLIGCAAQGQKALEGSLQIAFYNVENLFHPSDDSLTRDEAFTPEGQRYWSFYRYRQKTNRIAKVILSMSENGPPACIGLAEVENLTVLEDLAATAVLQKYNYKIVHYTSPDRRGIDVAALYQPSLLRLDTSLPLAVKLADDPKFKTRDILYLKMIPRQGRDTLHIYYNHWPSRYGGQAQSEPKRIAAALTLKAHTDSILSLNPSANIIIAGDFNDEWDNISLSEALQAGTPSGENPLINLAALEKVNTGSHRYKGVWSFLDQIIVSQALYVPRATWALAEPKMRVHQPGFLLEEDARYPGLKPYRTFIGFTYQEGFSDHLPVYINLIPVTP